MNLLFHESFLYVEKIPFHEVSSPPAGAEVDLAFLQYTAYIPARYIMTSWLKLTSQTAIITGAASGIGRGI